MRKLIVNISKADIVAAIRIFGEELPADEFFFTPESYGVVIGREVKSRDAYDFMSHKKVGVGEYGDSCLQGALQLAQIAVRNDVNVSNYVSMDGRGVAVSGFEELNGRVAQAVLSTVVWAA